MKQNFETFPLSISLQNAVNRFAGGEKIRSWALILELLHAHSEYGGGLGAKLSRETGPEHGERRSVDEWLKGIYGLLDASKVQQLHGRLAILGLSQLDSALHDYLSNYGFIEALQTEMKEPFDVLLQAHSSVSQKKAPSSEVDNILGSSEKRPGSTPLADLLSAAGYISDAVDAEAVDHLNIEREVANIAYVLTSKQVEPPLSLGLFGDWGSGKSFFMAKLQNHIDAIATYYHQEEKNIRKASRWCSRVVQIKFNAWHFSDANLWASLVTNIYSALHRELSEDQPADIALREKLADEVRRAEGVVQQVQIQFEDAKKRVDKATTRLKKVRERRRNQETTLNSMIGDVGAILKDSEVREPLEKATKALGYPEAAKTYAALEDLNTNLKSFSNRLSAVVVSMLRSPRTLIFLALLVIALPLLISYLLEFYGENLDEASQRVAEISTFLFGLIAWLKLQLGRGLHLVESVEAGLERARHIREEQLENNDEVKQAQQSLVIVQCEEEAARQNLQQAQAQLQHLQSELEELRPERKLYRLIEERGKSATYSQHLGIISLIRSDFERMSELFSELEKEQRNFVEEPPIQRIILYIDDLDRCRPERVVEVLEAIHLLLAFQLFVVMVGVDPRWLRHALAQHYPQTLSEQRKAETKGNSTLQSHFSTPQDYLEKIFQIPFALRPVEKSGYQQLVSDLLKPLPDQTEIQVVQHGNRVSGSIAGQQAARPGNGKGGHTGDITDDQNVGKIPVSSPQPFTPLDPKQLEFTDWEKEDIDLLWRLFRTPRTVKRFINTYRLLRAGLSSGEETNQFEGTKEQPGEYQTALILLAIVTSAPNETTEFLYKLGEWLEQPLPTDRASELWSWKEVINALRTISAQDDTEWQEIMTNLDQILKESFFFTFTKDILRKWAWRVARYSFSVHPAQALS